MRFFTVTGLPRSLSAIKYLFLGSAYSACLLERSCKTLWFFITATLLNHTNKPLYFSSLSALWHTNHEQFLTTPGISTHYDMFSADFNELLTGLFA